MPPYFTDRFRAFGDRDALIRRDRTSTYSDLGGAVSACRERLDAKEIEAGVTAIVPIGLVINLLTLKEVDQLKVATGEYNRALDKKIAEIEKECWL